MGKNVGKQFEENFKKSIDSSLIYDYRLKDAGSNIGGGSEHMRFTITNDYDMFLFLKYLFPMELKSSGIDAFSFGNVMPTTEEWKGKSDGGLNVEEKKEIKSIWKGKTIKLNQVVGLRKASVYNGVYAGFLFNFRKKDNETYWLNIEDFLRFHKDTNKVSINKKDVIEYGGIKTNQTLKRIHYKYNVIQLLCDITNEKLGVSI